MFYCFAIKVRVITEHSVPSSFKSNFDYLDDEPRYDIEQREKVVDILLSSKSPIYQEALSKMIWERMGPYIKSITVIEASPLTEYEFAELSAI